MTNTRLNEKRSWLTTPKKRTYGRSRSRREPSLFTCQKSQTASPWFLVAMAAVVMCVPPTESGHVSPVTPGGDALWDSAPIPGAVGGRGRKFASPICPIGSQASRSPPERLRLCGSGRRELAGDTLGVFDDSLGDGVTGESSHVVDVQLVHELLPVFFDGFDADEQFAG